MQERDELVERVQSRMIDAIAQIVLFNHVVSQQLGVGGSDGQFLTLIRRFGPMTPGQLAARSGLGSGTTTGVIDRLEKAGLVRRERDPDDRRKVLVVVDEDAIADRVAPLYASQGAWLRHVLSSRSPEELAVIEAFLADIGGGAEVTLPGALGKRRAPKGVVGGGT